MQVQVQSQTHSSRKPIIVVIGGQWGSEAKGMVAAALCRERGVDIAVRTGTVNAGHTVYFQDQAYKMQQLPTSWATCPATIVLGPGAYIQPKILFREIEMIDNAVRPSGICGCGDSIDGHPNPMDCGHSPVEQFYPPIRILIDHNAGLHLEEHTGRSEQSGRHHSMGATGKGCSEAVIDKIKLRGTGKPTLFRQWCANIHSGYPMDRIEFVDTSEYLNDQYRSGKQILVEGTQGSHLDLHLGPYPYTTHKQTQAAQWIQECGLGLGLDYEIVMVLRTYPIRVAGNSGPMPGEISWLELANRINQRLAQVGRPPMISHVDLNLWEQAVVEMARKYKISGRDALNMHKWEGVDRIKNKVALSELHRDALNLLPGPVVANLKRLFEFTTVTNKLRRVAEWRPEVARKAIEWNAPHTVVLSFFNYIFPELWNTTNFSQWTDEHSATILNVEQQIGQAVDYITTGPKTEHLIDVWLEDKVSHAQAR